MHSESENRERTKRVRYLRDQGGMEFSAIGAKLRLGKAITMNAHRIYHGTQWKRPKEEREEKLYLPIKNHLRRRASFDHCDVLRNCYYRNWGRPDLAGYVGKEMKILIAEVKDEKLKPEHFYQIRMYAERWNAKYALLISTNLFMKDVERWVSQVPHLLSWGNGKERITVAHWDANKGRLHDWFEKNPF